MTSALTQDEYYRYSRQIGIQGVGVSGQSKLKASRIAIVGVGGIGSPAALYAAASGIGHLTLIDPDHVSLSNLHRQILYQTTDVGQSKATAARSRLNAHNPHVQIDTHACALQDESTFQLLESADLVLDGSDNYLTRYLVNLACVRAGKPLISASVYTWSGQYAFLNAAQGPCYACLYPSAPTDGLIPNCEVAGTMSVVPGIIALQALNQGLKYLMGFPVSPHQLTVYDAMTDTLRHYPIEKKLSCPVCVQHRSTLEDFMKYNPKAPPEVPSITCLALQKLRANHTPHILVDVREPWEREICTIDGALSIPLGQFEAELTRLNPDSHIVLQCRSGGRSACATKILQDHGYSNVHNLEGGILEWIDTIDPTQPKY